MKKLILLSVLLFSQYSFSNCTVYAPVKDFNVAGYVINFDFTKMLNDKGYSEVYSENEANYLLTVEGIEQEGRFHKAQSVMTLSDFNQNVIATTTNSVTCFTMSCAVSDYAKSFRKAYQDLSKKLPTCR
mgnify:FL=1